MDCSDLLVVAATLGALPFVWSSAAVFAAHLVFARFEPFTRYLTQLCFDFANTNTSNFARRRQSTTKTLHIGVILTIGASPISWLVRCRW